jgi:myosin heavy subunit
MDADRRSFFFGATLSEIGFILFFALLLFAFYQRQTDSKTIEDVRAEAESLQAEIAARQAALAELEKYIALDSEEERKAFFSELVPRKELANQNNELKRQNAELEKKIEAFSELQAEISDLSGNNDTLRENIEDAIELKKQVEDALGDKSDVAPEDLAQALEAKQVIDEFNADATNPVQDPEALAQALEQSQRVGDLEGQVLNLRGRLGGRDLPPCWAHRQTGKVEFLFDLVITDEGLFFSSAAPEYRALEYRDIPNVDAITASRLQLDRFEVLAKPILDMSDRKQCRHYIAITDRSENAYKATLTVEDYFYKFVNRS